jgi:hypothetical protein
MASGAVREPLVVDHRGERSGSSWSHPRYGLPLGRLGAQDACQRAEPPQQSARCLDRDSGSGGGRSLSWFRSGAWESLRICRAIATSRILMPHRKTKEPRRSVRRAVTPEHHDSEIHNSHPDSHHRFVAERSVGEIKALDQQRWPRCTGSQLSELCPQSSLGERTVQPADGLTLNDRAMPYDVVTYGETPPNNLDAELLHAFRNSGPELVHIGCHHDHMAKSRGGLTEERDDSVNRAPTSHFAPAKWRRS